MLRVFLVWFYVVVVGVYAWKDWYVGLCGLILLVAVIQHPDMPKTVMGIQGLNPWNVLFISVVLSWLRNRSQERLSWDMPPYVNVLLLSYLCAVAFATIRMLLAPGLLEDSMGSLLSEHVINTLKWPVLGVALFDGCRNRTRFTLGMVCFLAVYFLLALQVIRWMPLSSALSGGELGERSLKILSNEVGYHRVNLSMMLAGAFWAMWAARPLWMSRLYSQLGVFAAAITFFGQALTAGRMGYATWVVVGFFLSLIRWRTYLLIAPLIVPVLAFTIVTVAPGVVDRFFEGFTKDTIDTARPTGPRGNTLPIPGEGPDMYTVTAGRTFAWTFVIDKIGESPLIGFGRESMTRTGLKAFLWNTYRESFPHPHNAYLEVLLDNGWFGILAILPFYLVVLHHSISLFRDSRSPVFVVSGGVACALVLALLVAAIGSQTFYPREGSVGMWCAIGLMFRVYVERARVLTNRAVVARVAEPESRVETPKGRRSRRRLQPGVLLRSHNAQQKQPAGDSIDERLWQQAA
ncbi:MAG: O-antigen ligase family protein [Candidatus Binatia bacterium]